MTVFPMPMASRRYPPRMAGTAAVEKALRTGDHQSPGDHRYHRRSRAPGASRSCIHATWATWCGSSPATGGGGLFCRAMTVAASTAWVTTASVRPAQMRRSALMPRGTYGSTAGHRRACRTGLASTRWSAYKLKAVDDVRLCMTGRGRKAWGVRTTAHRKTPQAHCTAWSARSVSVPLGPVT